MYTQHRCPCFSCTSENKKRFVIFYVCVNDTEDLLLGDDESSQSAGAKEASGGSEDDDKSL